MIFVYIGQRKFDGYTVAFSDVGMIEEVKSLQQQGLSFERMEALGLEYRYIAKFLQGSMTFEEMRDAIETKSRQYAKRQMTWLERDKGIVWVEKDEMERIEGVVGGFISGR